MTLTVLEFAQLITAFSACAAAAASCISVAFTVRNGHKIKEVHDATNSMKDELVKATADASHAEGLAQGREEGRNGH